MGEERVEAAAAGEATTALAGDVKEERGEQADVGSGQGGSQRQRAGGERGAEGLPRIICDERRQGRPERGVPSARANTTLLRTASQVRRKKPSDVARAEGDRGSS